MHDLIFIALTKGPNVLFILIDDVGWADVNYNVNFGMPKNRTMLIQHLTYPNTMSIFDIVM